MTASRFGVATAERLAALLALITDTERLAEVGDWLVQCDTAADFLARVDAAPAEGRELGRHLSRSACRVSPAPPKTAVRD